MINEKTVLVIRPDIANLPSIVASGKLKVRNGYASNFPLCARAPPFSSRMRPSLRANTHEPRRFPDGCNMNRNAELSVNRAELRAGRRAYERRIEPKPINYYF